MYTFSQEMFLMSILHASIYKHGFLQAWLSSSAKFMKDKILFYINKCPTLC